MQPVHRLQKPPNSAQLVHIPYHSPKLHPGPCNSVGMWLRTDTDRHTDTQTRVTTIYFTSSTTHAKCNKFLTALPCNMKVAFHRQLYTWYTTMFTVFQIIRIPLRCWPLMITGLIMAAQCNRVGHYIFALWFLSSSSFLLSSFFSSPNLSRHRLNVCHTSTHGVALVQIQNVDLTCAAHGSLEMLDPQNRQKVAIWASSHNFVGLYRHN